MPPRTIDNLGVDISTRWAEDQKWIDPALIREAPAVALQTMIDVMLPSYSSEWEQLFNIGQRRIAWALFIPPPHFFEQKKRLFTYQIMPSLGSEEKKEAQMQRVEAILPSDEEKEEDKKREKGQTGREFQEEKGEKKRILSLFKLLKNLNRDAMEIDPLRKQFQRG